MSEPKPAEQLRFSEALVELEGIVAALESGQLDLEDSLARYERGVALLRACQAKLSEAEHKVTMLMGEIQPVDGEE
jgi:exodeoxyribonuclease VII small subunit